MEPQNRLSKQIEALSAELAPLSDEELVERFLRNHAITVETITFNAVILLHLENRGYDVDGLRQQCGAVIDWYRRMAYGQVDPAAFIRFGHKESLWRKIAALPLGDQQSLAAGAHVYVLVLTDDGPTDRHADPLDLSPAEQSLVFGPAGIRSLSQQRSELDARSTRNRSSRKSITDCIDIDRKRRVLIVKGPCELTHDDLLRYAQQVV